MQFTVTEWMKRNENGWVAVDKDTHDVIDRDLNLSKLLARLDDYDIVDYTICKHWHRPMQYRDDAKVLAEHRAFLKANRDKEELKRFDEKIAAKRQCLIANPYEWPITPRRKAQAWLAKKGKQLKELLTP